MSIPLVQNNEKDSINTSIIAIKRQIERINMLLGLSNSEEIDTSKFATKEELQQAVTDLQPVDEVTADNMHSVTSNAVASAIQRIKSYFTTEQPTGGKWIDGKPIYRKVIEQNFGTGQTIITHNLGISRYIDVRVFVGSVQYVNSYLSSQYNISVFDLNVNTFAVTCNSWVGSGYIILEYTKTTD
jgi:hypothetical protein